MRSIVVAALMGGLLPGGLLVDPAMGQNCSGAAHEQANTYLLQPYEFPIGRRFVVSDKWNDKPTAAGPGETWTTNTVYQQLGKLNVSHAVSMTTLHHDPEHGWSKDSVEEVGKGIFELVEVEPAAITSDPTYRRHGNYFAVSKFAFSDLQVGATNEPRSPTDRYCVVQFTFQASLNPLLAPLVDKPGTAARKGRLLSIWDSFSRRWRFVATDLSPRAQDFASNDVPSAASGLTPGR
jgi:hypothetical protein